MYCVVFGPSCVLNKVDIYTAFFSYLQLAGKEVLKVLLQGQGEGQPAHVGGLPALPEVHHALEVLLRLPVLLLHPRTSSSFTPGTAINAAVILFFLTCVK